MHKKTISVYRPSRWWIASFIVLATLFFILPVSCAGENPLLTSGGDSNAGGGSNADGGVRNIADADGDGIADSLDVDDDNNGLIEIHNLDMFNNIRYNLAGTSYDDEAADSGSGNPGDTTGGPRSATAVCPVDSDNDGVHLCGYELAEDLDFAHVGSYVLGSANWTNKTWQPVNEESPGSGSLVVASGFAMNAGFPGIGPATGDSDGFTAIFDGKGHSISNFYSRNTANSNNRNLGLFTVNSGGAIRNLVVHANLYGGMLLDRVGALVAYNNGGSIIAGFVSGSVDGGVGDYDSVGGLVGLNNSGTIIASSAIGSVNGGDGIRGRVGGLVGTNSEGTITASYATGDVDGEAGNFDFVGGLVGYNNSGTITASYATGNAAGGEGGDSVGGLVGEHNDGTIIASYATGSADGEDNNDSVGGLVGVNLASTITASYATGSADGGTGNDSVGGLVGFHAPNSTITESYSFGTALVEIAGNAGTARPGGITSASALTAANAGTSPWWNAASSTGAGAWNFGMASENPALVYSDYDGAGTDYPSCSDIEELVVTFSGITTGLTCGSTLVGGNSAQGR